jgi:hypothetical protein
LSWKSRGDDICVLFSKKGFTCLWGLRLFPLHWFDYHVGFFGSIKYGMLQSAFIASPLFGVEGGGLVLAAALVDSDSGNVLYDEEDVRAVGSVDLEMMG